MYQIKLHRSIEKQLRRFPKTEQQRLAAAIRELAHNPRPQGSVHLREVLYRIRVGRYRVVYAIFEGQLLILVVRVARRSESTYKDLQALLARARQTLDEGKNG